MKIRFAKDTEQITDALISKNEVLMTIANYQMGTDPHSKIGQAEYRVLDMLFRSIEDIKPKEE